MKVMITENVALKASVVNGAEGTLRELHYTTDDNGNRFVDCAYVEIPGSNVNMHPLDKDVVPIFPTTSRFEYTPTAGKMFWVSRTQLPLLPAYAFTDYKAQGRSLKKVIIDLNGAMPLQSVYVMLSRATSLSSMAVLRNFNPRTLYSNLSQDFRDEFARLEALDASTTEAFNRRHDVRESEIEAEADALY
jgi:ATP-dependent exoDNAse (exonuclease V) alpha subunit